MERHEGRGHAPFPSILFQPQFGIYAQKSE